MPFSRSGNSENENSSHSAFKKIFRKASIPRLLTRRRKNSTPQDSSDSSPEISPTEGKSTYLSNTPTNNNPPHDPNKYVDESELDKLPSIPSVYDPQRPPHIIPPKELIELVEGQNKYPGVIRGYEGHPTTRFWRNPLEKRRQMAIDPPSLSASYHSDRSSFGPKSPKSQHRNHFDHCQPSTAPLVASYHLEKHHKRATKHFSLLMSGSELAHYSTKSNPFEPTARAW
ncbi:hypothetical protein T439DRAFT_320509 [Meredithblackwellia eburnea MCA 4105]